MSMPKNDLGPGPNSLARRLVAAVCDLSEALGGLVAVLLVLADHLDTALLVGDNADGLIIALVSDCCSRSLVRSHV